MTLHNAKKSAILQWFNSLCSCDVASITQLYDGKLLCDIINSVFNVCFQENKIPENCDENIKGEKPSENGEETSIQASGGFDECNLIAQRYKFLKDFIDGTYHVESQNLITYDECRNSSELELAKVAVFILTSVVRHFLELGNEQVNTLTLLESKVQEDIQECLSVLLKDANKLSREEMQNVLCKEANYTNNPPKRNSVSTPRRCSSKYRKSLTDDEVFSNSPLKSFLESPQFCSQISHAKEQELIKTRKNLHAEEIKVDDLENEVEDLKRKLKQKDVEILNLKNTVRQRKSRGRDEDHHECKKCKDLQKNLSHNNMITKELHDEIKILRNDQQKMEEDYQAQIMSLKTILEGRRKFDEDKCEEFRDLKVDIALKEKLLQQEIAAQKKLQQQIEELQLRHQKDISLLQEKLAEAKLANEQTFEEGEIIGKVIEDENKALENENAEIHIQTDAMDLDKNAEAHIQTDAMDLDKNTEAHIQRDAMDLDKNAEVHIQTDAMDLEAKTELEFEKIQSRNSISEDHSGVLMTELKNRSDILEINDQDNGRSKSCEAHCSSLANSMLSYLNASSFNQVIDQHDPEQKKEDTSSSESKTVQVASNGLGSLWANYTDSDSENYEEIWINNKNGLSKLKVDLLRCLGFSKTEYNSKLSAVRKMCAALKEIFSANGSNGLIDIRTLGDFEQNIKSEEDELLCLLYIKDSLLKFQNSSSATKEGLLNKLCNCDSNYTVTLNALKQENNELIEKLSEVEKNFAVEMQRMNLELEAISHLKEENKTLKSQITIINAKYEKAIEKKDLELVEFSKKLETEKNSSELMAATAVNKDKQIKHMTEEIMKLKLKLKDLSKKVETSEDKYATLMKEKDELKSKCYKRMNFLYQKCVDYEKNIKDFEQKVACQYNKKLKIRAELMNIETDYRKLLGENRSLQSNLHAVNIANEQLKSKIVEMQAVIDKKASNHPPAETIVPHEADVKIKEEKVSFTENCFTPKRETSDSEINSANPFNNSLKDVKLQDISTHSGALFSKHSFILPTDDEESYLNYSSIAEINSGKKTRFKELQRRNSIVPPHMRSSYATEVQCMSPYDKGLFDLVKHPLTNNDSSVKRNLFSVKKVKPSMLTSAKKKRKVSELDSDNEMHRPSSGSWKRRIKTESNFIKVLYRVNQDKKLKQKL